MSAIDLSAAPFELSKSAISGLTLKEITNHLRTLRVGLAELYGKLRKHDLVITSTKGHGYIWSDSKKLWLQTNAAHMVNTVAPTLLAALDHALHLVGEEISKTEKESGVPRPKSKKEVAECPEELLDLLKIESSIGKGKNEVIFNSPAIFKIAISSACWNSEFEDHLNKVPHELPLAGGTVIDLKTGKIRPRTKSDVWSYESPVCPQKDWIEDYEKKRKAVEKFMLAIACGDSKLLDYIQQLLGYCCTGEIDDRSFYIAWGMGKNGKSTLLDTICGKILNQAWGACDDTVLVGGAKSSALAPELIAIRFGRMIIASETEDGQRLKASQIKRLTGNDAITGRGLYSDMVTFTPQFKIILITNNKPEFNGGDQALKDRMKLLPFTARFEESITSDIKSFIDSHLEVIADWIFEGAKKWYEGGRKLKLPEEAASVTKEYLTEQNSVERFLSEQCDVDKTKDTWEAATALFIAYKGFCDNENITPLTNQAFYQMLMALGYEKKRSNGIKYKGITPKTLYR